MKKFRTMLLGLSLGIFGMAKIFAATTDDLLASYHFVGSRALQNNADAGKLKEIAALPETQKLRTDVLEKLARAAMKVLGGELGATNRAALLRPLFDDLLASESFAELHGKPNGKLEFFLAAQLDEAHSKIWETNLFQAAKAGKPEPTKLDDASGWQVKLKGGNVLKVLRAGKFTILFLVNEPSPAQSQFLKKLKSASATKGEWLEADIDWPQLQPWLPMNFSPFKPARMEIKISPRGEQYLRTTVRVIYPEKVDWKSQPWKIPNELIRDPLISFTVGRDLTPFFKPSKEFQQLSVNPLTNQMYFWAQSQMPFLSYFALPVNNATNALKVLGPQLTNTFHEILRQRDGGQLNITSNHLDVAWQGMPIIAPNLKPIKQTNGLELLVGELFPIVPNTNLPPAELFSQFSQKQDLVFYDWEITEARLGQWSLLSQLFPIFSKQPIVSTNASLSKRYGPARVPEQKWLAKIGPMLGNTVTEVTYKSPNELNVVRKSHIGLNSLELVLFSHWLAHPDFPSVNPFATIPGAARGTMPSAPSTPKKP